MAAGSVRGKQGPRRAVGNQYPAKSECGCVDGRGRPAPMLLELPSRDCAKCGHPYQDRRY